MQRTEAVFWDNDGVLVDTETLFFETTRMAFEQLGLRLTMELWGDSYLGQGQTSREIALGLGGLPEPVGRMIEERNLRYRLLLEQPPPIRPLVRETLSALQGKVKLAIVTGAPREQLHLIHRTTDLLGWFELIVTADDCPNPKPHPGLYLAAIKALGVDPSRCIAIEDSPRGLAAAQAARVPCVVVPTQITRPLPFPGALAIEADVAAVRRHITIC